MHLTLMERHRLGHHEDEPQCEAQAVDAPAERHGPNITPRLDRMMSVAQTTSPVIP